MAEQAVIAVSTVGNYNRIRIYRNAVGRLVVRAFPVCNAHEFRQQTVIIKKCVHLHRAFCRGIMRPVVDRQRKRYERRIQQPQRHLKTEFAMSPSRLLSEMLIEEVEDVTEYRTVAMSVLICHCRF